MRHLAAEAFEMLVHSPHRRRDPPESALDEHDLQPREALRHAFDNQTRQRRRHRMRIRLVLLGVVGRPAAAGRRVTAITADVNADGQPKLLGAGVNRPVAMAPERLVGAWRNIDLHVLAEFGAALDLGDRRLGVVLAH